MSLASLLMPEGEFRVVRCDVVDKLIQCGDGDAALPYLKRYPLALVLRAADGATPEVVAGLRAWLHRSAGKSLSYAQAAAIFPEFTPEAVARRFVQVASR